MDDTSREHIAALKTQAQAIIGKNNERLDKLCALLTETGAPACGVPN
jgi:hypothetical protein